MTKNQRISHISTSLNHHKTEGDSKTEGLHYRDQLLNLNTMTTEALRKVIKVTYWELTANGLTIRYERTEQQPIFTSIFLPPAKALKELWISGGLDDYNGISCMGLLDGNWYDYNLLVALYQMCQWECLSIIIRYEAEKDLANDIDMLELDSAINALK